MEHVLQGFDEDLGDGGEFVEGEVGAGELAVFDAGLDDVLDEGFEALAGGVFQRTRGTFHGIGEGDDGGFAALGNGARVAERGLGHLGDVFLAELEDFSAFDRILFLLQGALVEVIDERVAVVFLDDVDDGLAEAVLAGQVDAFLDVGNDDERAHRGVEQLVGVAIAAVVFDEVLRFDELADVVEVGADAALGGVGADGFGGGFGEVGEVEAVVVGAGGFFLEALENGVVEVGHLEPGDIGDAVEEPFEDGEDGPDGDGGGDAEGDGPDALDDEEDEGGFAEPADEEGAAESDESDADAGHEEVGAAADAAGEIGGGETGEERTEREFGAGGEVERSEEGNEEGGDEAGVGGNEDGDQHGRDGRGNEERGDAGFEDDELVGVDDEKLVEEEVGDGADEHQQEQVVVLPDLVGGEFDDHEGDDEGEDSEGDDLEGGHGAMPLADADDGGEHEGEDAEADERAAFHGLFPARLVRGGTFLAARKAFADQGLFFEPVEHESVPVPKGGIRAGGSERHARGFDAAVHLVGIDDGGHERVADDVDFLEFDHADAGHAVEGLDGFDEAGFFAVGQVDLGGVAGDDALGILAEAGQEHEHLLGGGVLGFVEDDEGVGEGAAAHVGEGGDFDDAAVHGLLDFLHVHHVVEGVVEGAEVGEDFFLEVAGQVAEGFAGFDGGAGEDDAGDLFGAEGVNGHGHGEEGFAGTGGADTEGEVVVLDGLEVGHLGEGFRGQGGFFGGDGDAVGPEFFQFLGPGFLDGGQGVVEFVLPDADAVLLGDVELAEEFLGRLDALFGAFYLEPGIAAGDFDVQVLLGLFEQGGLPGVEIGEGAGVFEIQRLAGGHRQESIGPGRRGEGGKDEKGSPRGRILLVRGDFRGGVGSFLAI